MTNIELCLTPLRVTFTSYCYLHSEIKIMVTIQMEQRICHVSRQIRWQVSYEDFL